MLELDIQTKIKLSNAFGIDSPPLPVYIEQADFVQKMQFLASFNILNNFVLLVHHLYIFEYAHQNVISKCMQSWPCEGTVCFRAADIKIQDRWVGNCFS